MTGTSLLARPTSVEEAREALAASPLAIVVAGGTEVVANQNRGRDPEGYVSLRDVRDLTHLQWDEERLRIGSMVTVAALLEADDLRDRLPALSQAARSMASRQIRERATVGGNICAGGNDRTLVPVLLALGASVELVGPQGVETAELEEVVERDLSGHLLTSIEIPLPTGPQIYFRVGPRNAMCYATASVALVIDELSHEVRLGLGGVAPVAVRAREAEAYAQQNLDWVGRSVSPSQAEEFGRLAATATDPVSDAAASADYRRHAVEVVSRRALTHVFQEG